ncbi:MAG: hypothetical protein ABIW34_06555, partial [Ginsengibacter sp.]
NFNSAIRHKLYGYYIAASDLYQIELLKKAKMRSYFQFGYLLENSGINPFNVLTSIEYNKLFQKTSVEINYKYTYDGKKNGLDIRLFAGTMLKNTANVPFYALSASGRSGREEYLFQGFYPDRFTKFPKSFWSRQMTLSEGGLVSPVNDSLGYSRWLISSSITSNLPGRASRIPVKPFVNVLLNEHGFNMSHNSPFFCEAGLMAGIWGIFEVYVPLLVSRNIESINGSFKNRIRIVLKLDVLKQVKLSAKMF